MSALHVFSVIQARQQVGQLLSRVLDGLLGEPPEPGQPEPLSPKQAIFVWTQHLEPQWQPEAFSDILDDPSIQAAYQALWFLESDETQQQQQPFYLDLQLTTLQQMIQALSQGQPLPPELLSAYQNSMQTHRVRRFSHRRAVWPNNTTVNRWLEDLKQAWQVVAAVVLPDARQFLRTKQYNVQQYNAQQAAPEQDAQLRQLPESSPENASGKLSADTPALQNSPSVQNNNNTPSLFR